MTDQFETENGDDRDQGAGSRHAQEAQPRRGGLAMVLLASLTLLLLAAAGWWVIAGRSNGGRGDEAPLTPPVSLESLATEYPQLAGILQDPKLDSVYKEFLVAYETGGEAAALELAEKRGLLNANGDLRLTLELDTTETDALEAELEANWIAVTAVSGNRMDIVLPLARLDMFMSAGTVDDFLSGITTLEHVVRIRLPQVDISDPDNQKSLPQLTFVPQITPSATAPVSAGDNRLLLVFGALLCVAAPLLFGLGVILLLSGLGVVRRRTKAPPSSPPQTAPPTGLSCPNCGFVNRPAAQFCSLCGAHLRAAGSSAMVVEKPFAPPAEPDRYCRNCGTMLRPGARFCPRCGDPA